VKKRKKKEKEREGERDRKKERKKERKRERERERRKREREEEIEREREKERYRWLHFFINHKNHNSSVIFSSTSSTTTHLNVLSSRHPSKVMTIEFSHCCEYNSLGGHIQSNRKCLRCEQTLKNKQRNSIQSNV
jgi:hypothetical protein